MHRPAEELDGALFAPDQPATVLGDPATGVVAVVECDDGAHIRLLAVDPAARGRGLGDTLVQAAEDWAKAGAQCLITGADPPYFLWPGVPGTETALLCLFERRHYARADTNFNMDVDLAAIPEDPGGHRMASPAERDEFDEFMAAELAELAARGAPRRWTRATSSSPATGDAAGPSRLSALSK